MIRLTARRLRGQGRRLAGTFVAILLGVSFMTGVRVLGDTTRASFDRLFATAAGTVDVVVRVAQDDGRGTEDDRSDSEAFDLRTVPASLADAIGAVSGVDAVEVVFETRRGIVVVDADGRPISLGPGLRILAAGFPPVASMNPYTMEPGGRAPRADDEVVLDRSLVDAGGFAPGDTVTVRTPTTVGAYRLVGVVTLGDTGGGGGAGRALFTPAVARSFVPDPSEATRILVDASAGTTAAELRDRVAPIVAPEASEVRRVEAVTGEEYAAELRGRVGELLDLLSNGLGGFAALSLFVGSFVIANTFTIIVAQRQQELALLRAVGASRRQLLSTVLLEAACVGAIAGLGGVLGGVALARGLGSGLEALGLDLPDTGTVLRPEVAVTSFLVGTVMAVLCAWFPARRAASIPPVAALRDVQRDRTATSATRLLVGAGVAIAATGLAWQAVADRGGGSGPPIRVGIATALAFAATALLGPRTASLVVAVLARPIGRRPTGRLARSNAVRNPRRTASTAGALTIGVAVVGFALVLTSSIEQALEAGTERVVRADVVVSGDAAGRAALPGDVTGVVRDVDGVAEAGAVVRFRAKYLGDTESVAALDTTAVGLLRLTVTDGELGGLGADGVALATEAARREGTVVGDRIAVALVDGTIARPRVVALVDDLDALDVDLVTSTDFTDRFTPTTAPTQLLVRTSEDASAGAVIRRLRAEPTLLGTEVQDVGSYANAQSDLLGRILGIFGVLLTLTVVIALFGIANTLGLSIQERTNEIGLLRAVGMTRRQVGRMVRIESVLLALLGTAQGLALGVASGWAMAATLANDPTAPDGMSVVVPAVPLLVAVAAATLAGLAAAVGAARRARRIDVLAAIATP